MSESSQRLAETIKIIYPDIAWREISGFRNILVHDYLGLDLDMICEEETVNGKGLSNSTSYW